MKGFAKREATNVIEVDFLSTNPMNLGELTHSARIRAENRGKFLKFCKRMHLSSEIAVEIWASIPTKNRNTKEALVEAYFLAAELAIKRK